ncbi:DUF2285 domain-containing protein [Bradyrhizobium yuanmingense]|uniref:DUF2285 domain-containing protein n=1 Tax=Bradyrhizobium yuanmingense TaxID=108015 RepID=UPI0023B9E939|nr:DUF2285 domain-containing protein [Bradyrhizobium yuanmingense]MDF0523354.1 DUF2285 domain-containing protein [Bradyrhizobium yuanmingense]
MLSTVLAVRASVRATASKRYDLDFSKLAGRELRCVPDGWHAIVALGGAKHRPWLSELPSGASSVAVDLPLDRNFEVHLRQLIDFRSRTRTAAPWTTSSGVTILIRHRLILALRAVDGSLKGNSYREIAQGLFGKHRIPDRGWKTDHLRSRAIRLVQTGLRLMRGGYRALLRRNRKDRSEGS